MEKGDAVQLFGFFERVPKKDRLFLKDDVTDRRVIEEWELSLDYDKVLPLVAIQSDTIVADATLHRRQGGWTSHIGKVRLVVDKAFRGKGLGSRKQSCRITSRTKLESPMTWPSWSTTLPRCGGTNGCSYASPCPIKQGDRFGYRGQEGLINWHLRRRTGHV
jgi:GNAT superfamily N-acetyltransferase